MLAGPGYPVPACYFPVPSHMLKSQPGPIPSHGGLDRARPTILFSRPGPVPTRSRARVGTARDGISRTRWSAYQLLLFKS